MAPGSPLAWSLYDNDGNRESQESYIIYPTDFTIPLESVKKHGITTERAKAEGTSLHKVLPKFNADVEKATTVIAHNLDFDLPIVHTEFMRCRLETNLAKKETFCTMKFPKIIHWCKLPKASGHGYKWPTLTDCTCSCSRRNSPAAIMPVPMWGPVRDVILN